MNMGQLPWGSCPPFSAMILSTFWIWAAIRPLCMPVYLIVKLKNHVSVNRGGVGKKGEEAD